MAKTSERSVKVNKSQQIRDILNKEGVDIPANDVVENLSKRGVEVTQALVNNIKFQLKNPNNGHKSGKRKGKGKNEQVTVATMIRVKEFANEVGGLDVLLAAANNVKQLVE